MPLTLCHCHKCKNVILAELDLSGKTPSEQMQAMVELNVFIMILCPICGNKRCPHAANHDLNCSVSNDLGQTGSAY
jgi:predicted nucleic-acid-binding Zn-ribbon protein